MSRGWGRAQQHVMDQLWQLDDANDDWTSLTDLAFTYQLHQPVSAAARVDPASRPRARDRGRGRDLHRPDRGSRVRRPHVPGVRTVGPPQTSRRRAATRGLDLGLRLRHHQTRDPRPRQARTLRGEGWSLAAIADLFGLHPVTIYRALGRGTGPPTVHGLDGEPTARHPRTNHHQPPCLWCGQPNTTTRACCTNRCWNRRRRYRESLPCWLPLTAKRPLATDAKGN